MNIQRILTLTLLSGLALFAEARQLANEYRLKEVIEIPGRQGVACDGQFYYISDTRALYKLDKSGNIVTVNSSPFIHPEVANHFGDIDYHDGNLYCGLEKFEYGRGQNISVAIYDANTLKWKRDLPWSPESGQVEVSGLAVDRERNVIWMYDWVDSRYVYCYDLASGRYLTKMQCRPTPYWCQGIFIAPGSQMIFSADDGEAAYSIPDNLYVAKIDSIIPHGLIQGSEVVKDTPFSVKLDNQGNPFTRNGLIPAGAMAGRLSHLREMSDFRRAGEIEGLAIDPSNGNLLVVNNRGTEIVLGMSRGPLTNEGYTAEIHELYIYEPIY